MMQTRRRSRIRGISMHFSYKKGLDDVIIYQHNSKDTLNICLEFSSIIYVCQTLKLVRCFEVCLTQYTVEESLSQWRRLGLLPTFFALLAATQIHRTDLGMLNSLEIQPTNMLKGSTNLNWNPTEASTLVLASNLHYLRRIRMIRSCCLRFKGGSCCLHHP